MRARRSRTPMLRCAVLALMVFVSSTAVVPAQELPVVRVGVVSSISDVVFSIGDRLGYFKEEGLRVDLVPFKSAADMVVPLGAGRMTIAVSSPGSGSFAALDRLVKKAGLNYTDVKPVSLGYPDHIVALRNGSVDAGLRSNRTPPKPPVPAPPCACSTATSGILTSRSRS